VEARSTEQESAPAGAAPRLSPEQAAACAARLCANVERALRGKPEVVRRAIETLIAGGHLLLEDVPGVGKTTLAHAIARSIDGRFRRIQFTSDLLPADLLGASLPDARLPTGSGALRPSPLCWRR
jgi:MoxR-like ATPase